MSVVLVLAGIQPTIFPEPRPCRNGPQRNAIWKIGSNAQVVRIAGQKFGREVRSLQVEPTGIRNVIRFRFRAAFCANARKVLYIQ